MVDRIRDTPLEKTIFFLSLLADTSYRPLLRGGVSCPLPLLRAEIVSGLNLRRSCVLPRAL